MYVSKRSLGERSGAVGLTAALTIGLLGAMLVISHGAAPLPAGDRKMQLFDVPVADGERDPEPVVEPDARVAEKPVPPAPAPAISAPAIVRASAPASEAAPIIPMAPVRESASLAQPASATGVIAHAAPPAVAARPAEASARAGEKREDADQYGRAVFREIRARQAYTAELAREGLTGTVVVEFRVSSRGRVYAVIVVQSDSKQLDRLAMSQVQSTPLPPPPRGEPRTFRIPMTYRTR